MCVGQMCYMPLHALHYSDSQCANCNTVLACSDHGVNMSWPVLMLKNGMSLFFWAVQDRKDFAIS